MLITIDSKDLQKLTGKLSGLGKVQLPQAASRALNLTIYDVRKDLQQGARDTFNSVVPFTVNSFLYTPSTPDRLEAVAYIRDDAPGGNPPALYLLPQIKSGSAYRTRFAKRLGREVDPSPHGGGGPILAPNRVMAPTQSPGGTRFTPQGNMNAGQYTSILADLGKEYQTFLSGPTGRKKPKGKAGDRYFYMNQTMVDERRNLRNRKPGIFLRRGSKYPLFRVMTEIPTPSLPVKFQFERIGRATALRSFARYMGQQKFL
jgi:hypothetical protein